MVAHCFLSMVEFNFLNNYSFEEDENGSKTVTGWSVNDIGGAQELYVEHKSTDSMTGTGHFHFWSPTKNSVEFTLEQEIKNLKSGTYKFSISIMGGDAGNMEIYSYVKINGEIVQKQPLSITSYGKWDSKVIKNINYDESTSIVVGIYVKCEGAGNGAWGKIDDALFNSQQD
jgi:arabinogalactan endo-1,4-beta-galactosidase